VARLLLLIVELMELLVDVALDVALKTGIVFCLGGRVALHSVRSAMLFTPSKLNRV